MSDTESFESVYERLYPQLHNPCGLWKAATIAEWLDDLERAHDREIRDTAQQEYHRGFEDGRHYMDAEHRAVAMRLRYMFFDGGSYENLSRIAYAIYPCATGWTCESAAGLRDKLVDLMGGVSDDTSIGAGGGACNADDCDCAGEQKEVGDGEGSVGDNTGDIPSSNRSRGASRDDNSSRGNRNVHRTQPKESEVEHGGTAHDSAADSRGGSRGKLVHMDGLKDDGTSPNDVPTSSITDELRECVDTASKSYDNTPWYDVDEGEEADHTTCHITEGELLRIADRIDEQFDRICQQQEAVLQSTIDGMVKEYEHDRLRIEKLEKQRDELQAKLDALDG